MFFCGGTLVKLKCLAFIVILSFVVSTSSQTVQPQFPVKRQETPETWRRDGQAAIEARKKQKINKRKAKNVILFVGDGMGITTLTAARPNIYKRKFYINVIQYLI